MVTKSQAKTEAALLRKRGFTLAEIAKVCDVSKATVSRWLRDDPASASVTIQNKRRAGQDNAKRLQLINKARQSERRKRYDEQEKQATLEYKHYRQQPLFQAGLMVYGSLGDRHATHQIRLSSTRADMHATFLRFAQEFLGVELSRVRFWLLCYPGQSERACVRTWSQATGLPPRQFGKTQTVPGAHTRRALHSGVGNTIIGSTAHKRKLDHWLALAVADLTQQ